MMALYRFGFWFLVGFVLVDKAMAHSWYEYSCCAGHDCHPIEGVRETDKGYELLGQLVPYGDDRLRISQDAQFHVCRPYPPAIRCLYVPARSF